MCLASPPWKRPGTVLASPRKAKEQPVSGMKRDAPAQAAGVTDLVGRLVDGLGQLLAQHVALARLELGEEARSLSRALGTLALFTPLLVVGYAMLCFGLAFALARWLSVSGAVLLVGAANLVVGGAGLWTVRKALLRPRLQDTTAAVRESAQALQAEAQREVSGVH
jgi:uncharacterized membrane protein YqjE